MNKKRKTSGAHASSRKPTKKCVMKIKQRNKKKRHVHKNVIHGRKPFIRPCEEPVKTICKSLEETIMDTMQVLFV